jgi:hypothetical protein
MTPRRSTMLAAAALATVLAAAPARAGEVDKYLPEDTELLISVNVRQIVDSELFKKHALQPAQDALKGLDQVQDVLKELNFDPFKDLDRVLIAKPAGNEQDRGLAIVYGRFDVDKLRARADDLAKTQPDQLKVHKVPDGSGGKAVVYEIAVSGQPTPVFVALLDKTTVLAGPGKDYVVDAIKKQTAKEKPTLKNKEVQALLEKMNDKQAVSVAGVGSALAEGSPDEIKAVLENLDAVGGGITVGDDIKLEAVLSAKSTDAAKQAKDDIAKGLQDAKLALGLLAAFAENPGVDLLADVVNSVKVSTKDKLVTINAAVSAEAIEEAFKKDKHP